MKTKKIWKLKKLLKNPLTRIYRNKIRINLSVKPYFMWNTSLLKNKNVKIIKRNMFKFKAKLPIIYDNGISKIIKLII